MAPKPTPTPKPGNGFANWGTTPTNMPTEDPFAGALGTTTSDLTKAERERAAKAKAAKAAAVAKEKERQRIEAAKRAKVEASKKREATQDNERGKVFYFLEINDRTKFIKAAQAYENKYKVSLFDPSMGEYSGYKTSEGSYYGLNVYDAKQLATRLLGENAPKLLKISYGAAPAATSSPTATGSGSLDDKAKADSLEGTPTLSEARTDNGLVNVYSGADSDGNLVFWWNGNQPGDTTGNQSASSYVYVVGDTTGKYVPSTSGSANYKAGSPVGAQEYVDSIIKRYSMKEGGLIELKQLLANKGAYSSDAFAARSLQSGEQQDVWMIGALHKALQSVSSANLTRITQNKNKNMSLIGFEGFMRSNGKLPSEASIGNGNNGTVITHRKFKPEEYEIAIDQLFQSTVGRGASEEELNSFMEKLRAYEQKNPYTQTVSGSGTGTETTTTSGTSEQLSAAAGALMREEALANPETEKNAKENKYFGYLMEAISSNNTSQLG